MNGYFQPINQQGFGSFTQAGQAAGWYRLNSPFTNALPVVPGIAVPAEFDGMLVQAKTDLKYCFSPSAAIGGATGSFNLPAGGTIIVPGQQAVARFCVLMGAAGTQFVVQFYSGSIPPLPVINAPSTGGVVPPPPPGLSAVPTINTVHVMKNEGGMGGVNGSGAINRLDLPFLDCINAQNAAQAGDTVEVWPGDYDVPTLGKAGVNWLLHPGANLTCASGPVFLADAITFKVDGDGIITCTDPAAFAVRAMNGGSIEVDAPISAAGGGVDADTGGNVWVKNNIGADALDGVLCNNASVTVDGQVLSVVGVGAHTKDPAAELVVNGDVESDAGHAAHAQAGSLTVNGEGHSRAGNGARCEVGATLHVELANSIESQGAYNEGTMNVVIDAIGGNGGALNFGTMNVGRDAITNGAAHGAQNQSGTLNVGRDATSIGTFGGGANCDGGILNIGRDAIGDASIGINCNAGVATVGRNAISATTYGAACQLGVGSPGGKLTVHGRSIGVTAGAYMFGDADSELTLVLGAEASAGPGILIEGPGLATVAGVVMALPIGTNAAMMCVDAAARIRLMSNAYLEGVGVLGDSFEGIGQVQSNYATGAGPLAATLTLTAGSVFNPSVAPV